MPRRPPHRDSPELSTQKRSTVRSKFDEEPMERPDRLLKLRSYLGAVDHRNQLELTTTEDSSTLRLNMTLSTQMYYILVMTEKLYRCHKAGVNEGFAGRRQFVREWEPRFAGLLGNVLSCRRETTQLPADEGLAHERQSSETVIDDITTNVDVLRMEDGRVKACLIRESTSRLIRESTRIASWIQMRKEILKISRAQQHADSNLVPVQIGSRRAKARVKTARTQGTNRARK